MADVAVWNTNEDGKGDQTSNITDSKTGDAGEAHETGHIAYNSAKRLDSRSHTSRRYNAIKNGVVNSRNGKRGSIHLR